MRPQQWLRPSAAAQLVVRRRQRSAEVEELGGDLLKHGSVRRCDAEFTQLDLRRCPRKVECPLRGVRIVIAARQFVRMLCRGCDKGGEGHADRLTRRHPDPRAKRDDRIEHRTRGARQLASRGHRNRVAYRSPSADEARTVSFTADVTDAVTPRIDDMHAPQLDFVGRPLATHCGDRRAPAMPFRFDEQARERRMRQIGALRGHCDFTVARELDLVRLATGIGERDATHFGRVGRHDSDLGACLDIAIDAVQRHTIRRQPGAAVRCGNAERLERR